MFFVQLFQQDSMIQQISTFSRCPENKFQILCILQFFFAISWFSIFAVWFTSARENISSSRCHTDSSWRCFWKVPSVLFSILWFGGRTLPPYLLYISLIRSCILKQMDIIMLRELNPCCSTLFIVWRSGRIKSSVK